MLYIIFFFEHLKMHSGIQSFLYFCLLGMEEEQSVHFSEHVFMERHLKGWCPKSGPIRHFMELVCVGLSKNPYLTVEEKLDHIMWYREYFESKQDVLQEVGAIQEPFPDKVKEITK